MNNQFTPGPWTQQPDDTFSTLGDVRIVGAPGISPAIVFGGIRETEANANLIALAPELYEVLQAFGSALDASDSEHENFLDSGADVVELLWFYEAKVRRLLAQLEVQE